VLVRSKMVRAASRRARSAAVVLAAASLAPAPAVAQAAVEIGPTVGYYAPLGNYDAALPSTANDLRGWTWGAQGRFWLTHRAGVLIEGSVRSSRFDGLPVPLPCVCCAPCIAPPMSARLVQVTVQAIVRPFSARSPLWLSAGAGVVRRSGQAYADAGVGPPTSVAAAVGCGVDARLAGPIVASLGITTLFYSLDGYTSGAYPGPGFQADLQAHLGLSWRWGAR